MQQHTGLHVRVEASTRRSHAAGLPAAACGCRVTGLANMVCFHDKIRQSAEPTPRYHPQEPTGGRPHVPAKQHTTAAGAGAQRTCIQGLPPELDAIVSGCARRCAQQAPHKRVPSTTTKPAAPRPPCHATPRRAGALRQHSALMRTICCVRARDPRLAGVHIDACGICRTG
jgi:hypothetical protein